MNIRLVLPRETLNAVWSMVMPTGFDVWSRETLNAVWPRAMPTGFDFRRMSFYRFSCSYFFLSALTTLIFSLYNTITKYIIVVRTLQNKLDTFYPKKYIGIGFKQEIAEFLLRTLLAIIFAPPFFRGYFVSTVQQRGHRGPKRVLILE